MAVSRSTLPAPVSGLVFAHDFAPTTGGARCIVVRREHIREPVGFITRGGTGGPWWWRDAAIWGASRGERCRTMTEAVGKARAAKGGL